MLFRSGFATDLKLNLNKYDIVLQSKDKKLVIPVTQFKNKDLLKLLELIEDKPKIILTTMNIDTTYIYFFNTFTILFIRLL